jgi:glycerophosphoryl diester phosphodiesterase
VIVIAHRGACGHRPEHTLESYALAAQMGADYLEPDLVCTRDGVLVCRHDAEISSTTDVAEVFPERRATKTLEGREVDGWFVEDLTLAELQVLRAREREPDLRPHNVAFSELRVPTFAELLELAGDTGRGVYPETKHPEHFAAAGVPLEPRLVEALAGFDGPVYVQSFGDNLPALRAQLDHPFVQLLRREAPTDPPALTAIAAYAQAIGINKRRVDEELVRAAHAASLEVHVFTLRDEEDAPEEYRRLAAPGVDAVFADHPDTAIAALRGGGR